MLLLGYLSNLAKINSFFLKPFSIISVELLDFLFASTYLVQMVIMVHILWHFAAHIYTFVMFCLTTNHMREEAVMYFAPKPY